MSWSSPTRVRQVLEDLWEQQRAALMINRHTVLFHLPGNSAVGLGHDVMKWHLCQPCPLFHCLLSDVWESPPFLLFPDEYHHILPHHTTQTFRISSSPEPFSPEEQVIEIYDSSAVRVFSFSSNNHLAYCLWPAAGDPAQRTVGNSVKQPTNIIFAGLLHTSSTKPLFYRL